MTESTKVPAYDLSDLAVLVVDDQEDVRRGLARLIGTLGCDVDICASGEEALERMGHREYDLVFTDVQMEGMSGRELLGFLLRRFADLQVVMITGHGTIEMAVDCLQNGAAHFITKPFDNRDILAFVEHAGFRILARQAAERKVEKYRECHIIAVDRRMREVMTAVKRVAESRVPVLIEGASGTGKELVAREIHRRSALRDKEFLPLNCAALPDSLLESELFGFKRGAFTGAHRDTPGLFEQVAGGTLFLDEVASMSASFQGKLLRVLQEKRVRPLGGHGDVAVDFRLVSASNRSLAEHVERGEFREDLYYRLGVMHIRLPALNDRKACIPALAEYHLQRAAGEFGFAADRRPELSPAAVGALLDHDWKGNVRELENALQRALVMCKEGAILPAHLGLTWDTESEVAEKGSAGSYESAKQKALEAFQRDFVENALRCTGGNISRAADLCGLTRAALQRIMRKHGMERTLYAS